jgi:hypothetical protein
MPGIISGRQLISSVDSDHSSDIARTPVRLWI